MKSFLSLLFFILICQIDLISQCIENPPGSFKWVDVNGGPCGNSLPTSVPFLRITPDARSGSMGEAGVALGPGNSSMHFNTATLAKAESDAGFGLSFSPSPLYFDSNRFTSGSQATNYFGYLSGYKHLGSRHTIGASIRYFHASNIPDYGKLNDLEFALGYAFEINDRLSLGFNGKYITTHPDGTSSTGSTLEKGQAAAMDLSVFYQLPFEHSNLNFGLALSNLGTKLKYDDGTKDYLPANFALGASWEKVFNQNHKLTLTTDINKLMVPTPQHEFDDSNPQNGVPDWREQPVFSSIINSWSDAEGGLTKEYKEFAISVGAEYLYKSKYALRAGYYRNSLERFPDHYMTMGLGAKLGQVNIDASYSLSIAKKSFVNFPNGLGLTLGINLNK